MNIFTGIKWLLNIAPDFIPEVGSQWIERHPTFYQGRRTVEIIENGPRFVRFRDVQKKTEGVPCPPTSSVRDIYQFLDEYYQKEP